MILGSFETLRARPGALEAYALTLLRWGGYAGIDPTTLPATWGLVQRFAELPAVARAIERELERINQDPSLQGINSFAFFNQADQITDSLRSLLQGGMFGSILAISSIS